MDEETTADDRPSRPSLRDPQVGTRLGRFTLTRLLGAGGMGVVWAAHDPDLDREIALKLLHREDASAASRLRFLREARAMARLKHANVLTVYEVGSEGSRDYIAMELVEGGSLDAWLAGAPPAAAVWDALVGAARGLAAAHDAGLVHRDFKPHNVLVHRDGRVLVTDFGLVRVLGEEAGAADPDAPPPAEVDVDSAKLTRTGSVIGTPAYMAPEQWAGSPSDARGDQFAFCVTAWQALTGTRPFDGDSLAELRHAMQEAVPRGGERLHGAVRAVLLRGLAQAPEARFPTMSTLLAALVRARGARRRRWLVASAAGVALASAGVVAALATRHVDVAWQPNIVTIEPTFDENADSIAVSPDGKQLAFTAQRAITAPWRIYIQPIEGGEPRAIGPDGCGWAPRWTRDGVLVFACGDQRTGTGDHLVEQRLDGSAPVELGPGTAAEPCGDHMLVIAAGDDRTLLARGDHRVLADHVRRVRCDATGMRYTYIRRPHDSGYADIELWLVDSGRQELLLRGGISDAAFTPGGRSLVIARAVGNAFDLYELVLSDRSLHRLTTGANARAVAVTPDGRVVVYDEDVTTYPLFDFAASDQRRTFLVESIEHPAVAPDGAHVVVERELEVGLGVVLVGLADGAETPLARGRTPFFSADGARVLFVDDTDPRRLLAVALAGGTPAVVATLPAAITGGVAGADGIHVQAGTRAFTIGSDGVAHDDGVDGLVFVSPAGRRAIVNAGIVRVDRVVEHAIVGRPAWVGDHELAVCDAHRCEQIDVDTGRATETRTLPRYEVDRGLAISSDGQHVYALQGAGHVSRRKITNFDARSWRP